MSVYIFAQIVAIFEGFLSVCPAVNLAVCRLGLSLYCKWCSSSLTLLLTKHSLSFAYSVSLCLLFLLKKRKMDVNVLNHMNWISWRLVFFSPQMSAEYPDQTTGFGRSRSSSWRCSQDLEYGIGQLFRSVPLPIQSRNSEGTKAPFED